MNTRIERILERAGLSTAMCGLSLVCTLGMAACNNDGTPDDSQGGTTGDQSVDPDDSVVCDEDTPGWAFDCFLEDVDWVSDHGQFDALEVPGGTILHGAFGGGSGAGTCCGGCAPETVVDQQCEDDCLRLACDKARDLHRAKLDLGLIDCCSGGNCGFDYGACITGANVQHSFDCIFVCGGICGDSYNLKVNCNARDNETRNTQTGCAEFVSEIDHGRASCGADELGLGRWSAPGSLTSTAVAVEDAGTEARVEWTLAGGTMGLETSKDLEVDASYKVRPCSRGECIEISSLRIQGPDPLTVGGFDVKKARLTLIGNAALPIVSSRGRFSFPANSLLFSLDYFVAGFHGRLTAANASPVTGSVLPGRDVFALDDITLGHQDGFIDATLTVDVGGVHSQRSPVASITTLDDPASCSDPVVFSVTSSDPDGDPVTHVWDAAGTSSGTGKEFPVVLARGETEISVLTQDDHGHHVLTQKTHNRKCR